jgi:hypothetical protein
VALAVDMPDAPATQDTVTAGNDGDDDEGNEGNDQPDDLPDPEDAPVTTETITSGENEGSKEDKDDEESVGKAESSSAYNAVPIQSCPKDQERGLFTNACIPIASCNNVDSVCCNNVDTEPNPPNTNDCVDAAGGATPVPTPLVVEERTQVDNKPEDRSRGGDGGSGGDVEDNTGEAEGGDGGSGGDVEDNTNID